MLFKANPRFVEELEEQDETKDALVDAAEDAAKHVRAHQIMRRKDAQPIEVDDSGDTPRLVNTDHGAHLDEWGSANNPPYAPLRTGVRAAGLRLDESGT